MNEVLAKLKEDIDTLYATRESNIASLKNQIETANADAEKADRDMLTASDAEDIKGYSKAKAAKDAALSKASMCGTKLRRLESNEIVTAEEQKAFADAVRVEQDAALAELTASVKDALLSIADAYNKAIPVINDGDNLLDDYHHKIKPFQKKQGMRAGVPIMVNYLPLSGSDADYREMYRFLNLVFYDSGYKRYAEQDAPVKSGRTFSPGI